MIGHIIFLFGFSHMIDFKGRKPVILYALVLHGATLLAIAFCPSFTLIALYVAFGLNGISSGILNLQGWIYLIEFMPKEYQAGTIIISNSGKGLALILGSMFFLEVSNQMFWFFIINSAIIGVIFLIASRELPESPKYYYM